MFNFLPNISLTEMLQLMFGETPHEHYSRFFLLRSSKQPLIRFPFTPDLDGEPKPLVPHFREAPWSLTPIGAEHPRYRVTYTSDACRNNDLGTIVIPRHHEYADLIVAVTSVPSNAYQPPIPGEGGIYSSSVDLGKPLDDFRDYSAIEARFLVDSRVMYANFPRYKNNFNPYYRHRGQILTNGLIYGLMEWVLPEEEIDLMAIWLVLTIVHGRYPEKWAEMDLPIDVLYGVACFMEHTEIQHHSKTWYRIAETLHYTIEKWFVEVGRANNRDVAKWMTIARVFEWQTEYATIWANLLVSTRIPVDGDKRWVKRWTPKDVRQKLGIYMYNWLELPWEMRREYNDPGRIQDI
ncbi:hypothetical protein ABW19_dt0202393 [Dactylella cylindrospora]|nr:hypothetical protein ABW19_dt0202393 [Dactylella cylindrospora]